MQTFALRPTATGPGRSRAAYDAWQATARYAALAAHAESPPHRSRDPQVRSPVAAAVGRVRRAAGESQVYNRLPRDAYFALLDEAKAQGLAVAGHVPLTVSAAEASEAGQKSIEHLSGILVAASSTNARASCESFRFAAVNRTASGTPRLSQIT